LFRSVEIVRERPELGDHHQVEDGHPKKVRDADVEACAERDEKQSDVQHEEERDPLHELHAIDARREGAVRRNEEEQEQRLARRRVALHLRAALAEDEHLARGLQEIVRGEDEKHDQRHQEDADQFVAPDVGDRRQQPLIDRRCFGSLI
jgi:hypothetical protein